MVGGTGVGVVYWFIATLTTPYNRLALNTAYEDPLRNVTNTLFEVADDCTTRQFAPGDTRTTMSRLFDARSTTEPARPTEYDASDRGAAVTGTAAGFAVTAVVVDVATGCVADTSVVAGATVLSVTN